MDDILTNHYESSPLEKLTLTVDTSKLLDIFFEIAWTKMSWSTTYPTVQSGLQTSPTRPTDYLYSCAKMMAADEESQFVLLHPEYKSTYIEDLLSLLPFEVYRLRWMILFGKSCYSFHQDWSKRVHFPVITNPQSYFVFKQPTQVLHLEEDAGYIMDTRRTHSALNGADTYRVHLVGNIK